MAKVKYQESVVLKAGVYSAEVESVDPDDGQYGPQFKFIFGITEGKSRGAQIFGWASQVLTPKSKLTSWAEAILGVEVGKGYELDTDELVGGKCRLVLSVGERADGSETNKITSVLPFEAEEEEEEEDDEEEEKPARKREPVGAGARGKIPF